MKSIGAAFLVLIAGASVFAQAPPVTPAAAEAPVTLNYRDGKIVLGNNLAELNLPPTFRYLDPADTEKVLAGMWGNPPGQSRLGMLIPADTPPDSEDGWGIIITYEQDGYVKDDDADHINYNDLLKEMKSDTVEANEERKKAGFGTVDLVGWATPPRYDKAAKKLFWAKELKFADAPNNTLNYNIRILGRRGVLVLNAVAGMEQLKQVEAATPSILQAVDFQSGNRYADFTPGTDKIAAYGIGALVAGKLAAKVGLFKGLIALLIAGKKLVVVGVVAAVAGIKRLFGGRSENA